MKSGSSTRVERYEFFSQLLLHYRLTILESLNVYDINLVICKCEGNKQPINQNNVYERNNYSKGTFAVNQPRTGLLALLSAISEASDRRSTYDRSELVCRRKSWEKNLAGTQPHARVPSPKFGEINCENPFACETSFSRALGPVLFYTKHTQNAKINLSRPPRMGVARGCGPHLSAFWLKKLSNLFDT